MNKTGEIRVGTSGYSFEDWKSSFYPEKIEKGKMLDHYVKFFNTVEINSTYYRIPHPAVMYNMVKKAPDGFDFIIKVPQALTHRRTDLEKDVNSFNEAIRQVKEAGKLSGLLAQFPYSFKYSQDHLDYLKICRDAIAPETLFVEFRHNGWVNRPMYDFLKAENIGCVAVDEPQLPNLLAPDCFATTDRGYIRLHGRNNEHWWGKDASLRYDYNYSKEELEMWQDKTVKLVGKVKKVHIFFNNCHHGQAAKNALEFKKMLGI